MPEIEKPTGERIAKLLARAGVASRREIERMIAEGRIALDGVTLDTPATILPGLQGVTVDGKPVQEAERTRLFLFHKPSGLITAERDMAGRPTIYAALRNALPPGTPRLMPVGRLDLNTEGLLLMTNDGELKRLLELPSSGVPRTYRARTFGDITQAQLESLIEGIEIDGIHYGRIDANMERSAGHNKWIELTLTEGKNREVRRVLEYFGLSVSRLIRTSYGPLELLDLPRGAAIELRREDLDKFLHGMKTRASGSSRRTDAAPAKAPEAVSARPAGGASARPARPTDNRRPPRQDDRPDRRSDSAPGRGGLSRSETRGRGAHASDRTDRRPGAFSDPRPEAYRSDRGGARNDRGASRNAPWSDRFGDPRDARRDGPRAAPRDDQRGGRGDFHRTDRRDDRRDDRRGPSASYEGRGFNAGRSENARGEPRRQDDQRRSGPPRGAGPAHDSRGADRRDRPYGDRPFGDRRPQSHSDNRSDYRGDNRSGGRRDDTRRDDSRRNDNRSGGAPRGYGRQDDQNRGAPRGNPHRDGPRSDGPSRGGPNRGGPRSDGPSKGPSGGRGRPSSPYNSSPRGPRGPRGGS